MNTQASAATAAFLEPHQPPDLAPQPLGCGLQPAKKASVSAPLSRRENFMLTSYTMCRRRFVWYLPRVPQPRQSAREFSWALGIVEKSDTTWEAGQEAPG